MNEIRAILLTLFTLLRSIANEEIILDKPHNVTAGINEDYRFECSVPLESNFTVFWYSLINLQFMDKTELIANHTAVQIRQNSAGESFVLYDISRSDEGWYSCFVEDDKGNRGNTSIYLTVIDVASTPEPKEADWKNKRIQNTRHRLRAPYLIESRKFPRVVVKPTQNYLELKCPAAGNPYPNITWLKDGSPVSASADLFKYDSDKWSIEKENSTSYDSGKYTCIVCNKIGCANHTFDVHVIGYAEMENFY
ncbi:fibroblast growth factor receptor-like 1 [Planococcus citri]|uniref:fibroblast growth factor receptor-like 1 n=1 Tax=Planococcus citri TaxID=170843 RepID=UPI0031F9C02D